MKKMYFIFNLSSGKATIGDMLGNVIDEFTKAGFEVTAHPTQSADDAVSAAAYACDNNFDVLVCAGGDGTLNNCLNGIMKSEHRIPVGYIPTGSTNDFARTLGIPASILGAVNWIIEGTPKYCDVGCHNGEYFTYISAFGAFTSVTYETPQQLKNVLGHTAYVLNSLLQLTNLRSKRMRVEYDGNVIEDDFIYGMVTNSSSVAGLLSLNDFLLDDGQFEVTLIKKPANPVQLQQILHSLLNMKGEFDKEYIRYFRTSRITFTVLGDESVSWTRDGEYGGEDTVNVIENHSRAIPFLIGPQDKPAFTE
ncbi:MAG: YegS/Rv2252/BmrU family lipid kinase [Ruminococcus sp.]|nr:YegS/Rv2252/BmrU family lipid kinase [Ruminococcus sp.]